MLRIELYPLRTSVRVTRSAHRDPRNTASGPGAGPREALAEASAEARASRLLWHVPSDGLSTCGSRELVRENLGTAGQQ